MNYLRIMGALVGAGAAIAFALWIAATFRKASEVDGYRACSKAAATIAVPIDACDATVKARVTAARRAEACQAALAVTPNADAFAVSASCPASVKRLYALHTADVASLADANAQILRAGADRDAAVTRAETRASSTADRKAANDKTIQTAPRGADGRVHCDAQCLRDLAR